MKKILVVCAAILTLHSWPLLAQEADDAGSTGVEFSIIPRLDLSMVPHSRDWDFALGNSSLYTLFEGNITENLSFSVANHWMSFYDTDDLMGDTKALYDHTFWHSDTNNWLDWAYLEYTTGDWIFTLGKNTMLTGGYEYDAYDWDLHSSLGSSFWNNFQCYQWGGRVGYALTEDHVLSLELTTSPYGELPFSSGLFAASVGWRGSIGPWQPLWSFSAIQRDDDEIEPVFYFGNRFELEPVAVELDLSNRVGDELLILDKGFAAHCRADWSISDHFSLLGKVGYEDHSTPGVDNWNLGAAFHWFPLKESQDLRVHATVAYDTLPELATLTVGVLYNLKLF